MNRIDVYELVKSGFKTVEFDPLAVKLVKDTDTIPLIKNNGNVAVRKIMFTYDNKDHIQAIWDANYSFRWGNTNVKMYDGIRNGVDMYIVLEARTTLRKSPNRDEWSQASLKRHEDNCKKLDKFGKLSYGIEEFKAGFVDFNKWYKEEQTREVVEKFGKVSMWDFKEDSEIVEYDAQIKSLENTVKALKEERFKTKSRLVINCIINDSENISDDFKEPLLARVKEEKSKGYVDSFRF